MSDTEMTFRWVVAHDFLRYGYKGAVGATYAFLDANPVGPLHTLGGAGIAP